MIRAASRILPVERQAKINEKFNWEVPVEKQTRRCGEKEAAATKP